MPFVIRTGIDIVHIPRIARAFTRFGERFLQRIYTPDEISICAGRPHALAARWAAKEALAKLLGVGVVGPGSGPMALPFRDLEILRTHTGKPVVMLHGRALTCAREQHLTAFDISLSHDGDYAVASAVACGQAPDA